MTPGRIIGWMTTVAGGLWLAVCGAVSMHFVTMGNNTTGTVRGLGESLSFFAVVIGVVASLPGFVVLVVELLLLRTARRAENTAH